ncbi:MAG: glutamate racemase [Pseudomonadota bacterium]
MQLASSTTGEIANTSAAVSAPVGVFDSGVGGLSVLQHIRRQLPHESLLYFADAGFAPYGDKPEAVIVQRSLAIAEFLLAQGVKALVVACNTATAAAIAAIRQAHPSLIVVGVEPGLKPAIALSKSGIVGVLATSGTLQSQKFIALREQLSQQNKTVFLEQACIGLADQIEKGELHSPATTLLIQRHVAPLLAGGADTLVLGCTHYPFVLPLIQQVIGQLGKPADEIGIIDTGDAVARQLARLLAKQNILNPAPGAGSLNTYTTGSLSSLANALSSLLKLGNAKDLVQAIILA